MREINLLDSLPKLRRNVKSRRLGKKANQEVALRFGREYFDGPREQGYGGYVYDGRWIPVAKNIVTHFGLGPGCRVLDIGCAKGFLVKDLMAVCPGLEVFGFDISEYAVSNCEPEVSDRLSVYDVARPLPYANSSFNLVVCINTLHNIDREDCINALREIERISGGRAFIQVDAYRDELERELFLDWMLTAKTFYKPEIWKKLFEEAGYSGDYYWTILESDPEWVNSGNDTEF